MFLKKNHNKAASYILFMIILVKIDIYSANVLSILPELVNRMFNFF